MIQLIVIGVFLFLLTFFLLKSIYESKESPRGWAYFSVAISIIFVFSGHGVPVLIAFISGIVLGFAIFYLKRFIKKRRNKEGKLGKEMNELAEETETIMGTSHFQ